MRKGSCFAVVNDAVEGFVKSAASEMPKGLRLNCVSPSILRSSLKKHGNAFLGFIPISDERAASAYLRSLTGIMTGKILKVW